MVGLTTYITIFNFRRFEVREWNTFVVKDGFKEKYFPDSQLVLFFRYPKNWAISKLPDSISYNQDISINTGDPNFQFSVHASGPVYSNNCEFYSDTPGLTYCKEKQKKNWGIIIVESERDHKKQYLKEIFSPDRTFTIIASFETKEQYELVKKIARTFTVYPFNAEVKKSEIKTEEIEKQIKIDPAFVSAVEVSNDNIGSAFLEIRSLNTKGEFESIYHEDLDRERTTVYFLNSMPILQISRYPKSEINKREFVDLLGRKQSNKFFDALIDQHTLLFPSRGSIFYINPKQEKDLVQNNEAIFEVNLDGETLNVIKSDILPLGVISSTRLVGWSSDNRTFYATRIGWEGYEYSGLWKVNIGSGKVEEITGANKITLGALSVVPNKDLALGIQSTEVPCQDCMSSVTAGAPSQIVLFDLKKNSSKTIYTSQEKVIYNPTLSPDGKKGFFYEASESGWTIFEIELNSGKLKNISSNENLVGMSYEANRFILAKPKSESENFPKYRIFNMLEQTEKNFEVYVGDRSYSQRFLMCDYPLGFSCLYN